MDHPSEAIALNDTGCPRKATFDRNVDVARQTCNKIQPKLQLVTNIYLFKKFARKEVVYARSIGAKFDDLECTE